MKIAFETQNKPSDQVTIDHVPRRSAHSVNKINWPKKGSNPVVGYCAVSKDKYPIIGKFTNENLGKLQVLVLSKNGQRSCAFDVIILKAIFFTFVDIYYDISEYFFI